MERQDERQDLERNIAQLSTRLDIHDVSPSADDIDQVLILLEEVDTYLTRSVFGGKLNATPEQNIVFLGTTGAGKSTVVTFLFGEEDLVVRHRRRYARELVTETPLPGVTIQSGSTSSTLLPVVNLVDLGDRTVAAWDMPGSRDTRGPFLELLVHFIYQWLLKSDNDLRFVIVSPPPLERPQQVALESLINGSLIRADNAVAVYTKCGVDFDPNSTSDLDIEDGKQGIRSFALPAPVKEDEGGHNYSLQYQGKKTEIVKALKGLQSYAVTFDQPLPDAAVHLLSVISNCCFGFAREVLSASFLSAYDWNGFIGTLEEIEGALDALRNPNLVEFDTVADILLRLVPHSGQCFGNDPEVIRAGRRLTLVGTIANTDNSRHFLEWLNADCIRAIEDAKERLLKLRNDVLAFRYTDEWDKILVLSSNRLRVSSELHQVLTFVDTHAAISLDTIPIVILIGYSSLEVDTYLHTWANVALVSPSIDVTTKDAFDLSATGQAKCGQNDNVVVGKRGEDGMPGLPGGNLFVVCNKLEDPNQILRVTACRGQHGGDAGSGGDGVNGADSTYSMSDFERTVQSELEVGLPTREGDIFSDGLQVDSYINPISQLSSWCYSRQAVKLWTITKASVPGEKGIRPGSRGFGGEGGKGGRIHIQEGGAVWEAIGNSGVEGKEGAHGKPSRDGRSSPSFSAKVEQWYFPDYDTVVKPKVDFKDSEAAKLSPWIYAKEEMKDVEAERALADSSLDLHFVQETYDQVRMELETKFPRCDFSNLDILWET